MQVPCTDGSIRLLPPLQTRPQLVYTYIAVGALRGHSPSRRITPACSSLPLPSSSSKVPIDAKCQKVRHQTPDVQPLEDARMRVASGSRPILACHLVAS